jgi:hypothetical protein
VTIAHFVPNKPAPLALSGSVVMVVTVNREKRIEARSASFEVAPFAFRPKGSAPENPAR